MIVWLSIFPVRCATSSRTWPAAYASAEELSISVGAPPTFAMYAWTKSALPVAVESGYQSPEEKTPAVLFAPTLSGNSTGELAPLLMNSHFGLNRNWTIDLTCWYASSDWVPDTTTSGLAAATLAMIGVRSGVSAGYVASYTVLIPAASNFAFTLSAIGLANGSSSDGYAAVFGRWSAGRDRM